MQAVILVGGEGTRLRPLTVNVPKPMLPLANRPFLEHVLANLRDQGIDEVILSMGYRSEVIEQHVGDGERFGVSVRFVVESSPLGTAGGVKNVARYIRGRFFVFNGDILTDLDLQAMLEFHQQRQATATIALTPVDDPTAYGLVETDGAQRVQRFLEKPRAEEVTTNLINAGTYVLEPRVLDLIPEGTYHMFERGVFPELLQRGDRLFGYSSDCYWIDIGTPAKYLAVHQDVLSGRVRRIAGGQFRPDRVEVGRAASIDPSVTLQGPILIGDSVRIEAGCRIEGPTTIGDGSTIGPRTTIARSVLWDQVRIGAQATLADCIIGTGVVVDDDVAIAGGAVVSDGCVVGRENRLDRAVRIWPGRTLAPRTITF